MNPVKKLRFYIHRIEQLEEKCTELAACVEKLTKSTEELQKVIMDSLSLMTRYLKRTAMLRNF